MWGREKLRGHRRTTRTRRPQIRYHLATTRRDLHARVPSSSRSGKKNKRKSPEEERERETGQRSIFSPVFPLTLPSPLRSIYVDLRSRRSVDNAIVPRSISFSLSFFPFLFFALRINSIVEMRLFTMSHATRAICISR